MNRIQYLNILNFRHLNNIFDIKIGEKLTIIAGGNGTGKSSLLGLIGHIFSYRNSKNVVLESLDSKHLETEFSEVFRFSPDHDHNEVYEYALVFEDGTIKDGASRYIEKNKRFRIDVGERKKASGKIRRPVIYLGLKRLIPLAQEKEYSIKTIKDNILTEDDKKIFNDWHNRILVLDDLVIPQHMKSQNKDIFYPTSRKYDAYGNSAGQDNLAQIIIAVLTFKRLKEELKDEYTGGLLLIDEIETTLYPAAQNQLLHLLLQAAGDYDLQIIFTTHSIEIISFMLNPEEKDLYYPSEIIYLRKHLGLIEAIQDKHALTGIIADLKHNVQVQEENPELNVYLEDEEARLFFKGIIRPEIRRKLAISTCNAGADFYGTLLKHKFPEFKKSLIVLDGDKNNDSKLKRNKNVILMPGTERPENVIYNFLNDLCDTDTFWSSDLGGYDKNVFLNHRPSNTTNRNIMKNWFNSQKSNWGRGCSRILRKWKSSNVDVVNKFNEELNEKINKLYNPN